MGDPVASVPNSSLSELVRFGVYEVDPRTGELRRNGIKVKIQEQPFQVLALLLERPGEVISREELKRRLWPADTFVDFDHSLNAAIKRLRDALRDSADNPRFVETLSRRGYRFIAPVTGQLPDLPIEPHASSNRKIRARWIAAGIVFAGACISIGFHIGNRAAAHAVAPREVRLTANSPDIPVYRASISPDGRLLAYTDPRGLFLRDIDREDSHALSFPEGFRAHTVQWFPDASHVLVGATAGEKEDPSLWSVSILGGSPRKLVADTESGAVSPDGSKIAFLRGTEKLNQSELWVMNADGSETQKLVDVTGYLYSVVWSPGGRRLAYLKVAYWPGKPEEVQVESYDLENRKSTAVFSDYRLQGGLAWTRDGRLLFNRAEYPSNGQSNIWAVSVDERSGQTTGEPVRVTSGPDWKPGVEVSGDGKRLLFLRTNVAPTVYVAQVEPKTRALKSLDRLTLDESQSWPYEWTPDGKSVLFKSNRDGGDFHIFRQAPGALSPELLVDGPDSVVLLRLSPDATQIFYLAERKWPAPVASVPSRQQTDLRQVTSADAAATATVATYHADAFEMQKVPIMRAPSSGGAAQLLLEDNGINNFQCARAPSSLCLFSKFAKDALVFVEFDPATGAMKELFRRNEPNWEAYNWTLSPDGDSLALCNTRRVSHDSEIRVISLRSGNERTVHVNEWAGILAFDWAADGQSFWASASLRGDTHALLNIDLRGNVKTVVQGGKPYIGWAIPSRDGKHLALWQATGASNAWMLEGF